MNIVPRSVWSPKHGIGLPTPRPQVRVVIHHAPERAIPPNPTREQVAAQIRIMEDWHVKTLTPTNPRIGYQFIAVEQTGEIWEGLGWDRIGAHVGGHNTASLGILIAGINGAKEVGSDRTWRAIGNLIHEGIRRGSLIDQPALMPHRQYRATSCPGDVLARYVDGMGVRDLLSLAVHLPDPEYDLAGEFGPDLYRDQESPERVERRGPK